MKTMSELFKANPEDLSLEELKILRKFLSDISLDGNNGEGDDGEEQYVECNKKIKYLDVLIKHKLK